MNRKRLLKAIADCEGRISGIMKRLGCSSHTIYKYINSDPEVAQAIDDARDKRYNEIEEEEAQIIKKARENCHEWVKNHKSKATQPCVNTSHLFVRMDNQRRQNEKIFAPWNKQGNDIDLSIAGITDDT